MRVFVAGATGAMGKQLVPRLLDRGHRVVGMTRSESKQAALWDIGAEPVVADALDPEQVAQAVADAQPDVIVHELTAIGGFDMRHFDQTFALTNRLRSRSGRGRQALRRAELHELALRTDRRSDQKRGRPARSRSGA